MGLKKKGRQAFKDGLDRSACPYSDTRTHHGSVTFSRAFIRAWLRGWNAAAKKEEA